MANVIFSFDIEEHHRIEAANGVSVSAERKVEYAVRMETMTRKLLDLLARHQVLATFYIVGELAETHPELIRAIANAGHEIGAHGWDHQRVHNFNRESFQADVARCKEALESVSGCSVSGYRAPTFSVVPRTAWAIAGLQQAGYRYDSSIFPVRHDRYGIRQAPRTPFLAEYQDHALLEIPPATWQIGGQNLPVAGGGYFRLFPLRAMHAGIAQLRRRSNAPAMLYFHPWEFDPDQPKLPLKNLSRFRTYVGIRRSMARLDRLLQCYASVSCRAIDVVEASGTLPRFRIPSEVSSSSGSNVG